MGIVEKVEERDPQAIINQQNDFDIIKDIVNFWAAQKQQPTARGTVGAWQQS